MIGHTDFLTHNGFKQILKEWFYQFSCPVLSGYLNLWSHHQLQDAPDVGLATQVLIHTYVSTYSKVISSCRVHQTSAADVGWCQLLMSAASCSWVGLCKAISKRKNLPYKKTCPCTIIPPPCFNFSDPPLPRDILKFTPHPIPPPPPHPLPPPVSFCFWHVLVPKYLRETVIFEICNPLNERLFNSIQYFLVCRWQYFQIVMRT